MNLRQVFPPALLTSAILATLAAATSAQAQGARGSRTTTVRPTTVKGEQATTDAVTSTSAATDPVGFTSLSLPANSDSRISIPFTRPAVFSGAIGSVSGSTITVAASPSWTANQYVYAQGTQSNTYYAIIGPLLKAVSGTVSATNGSTAVTATGGLSSLVAGDEIIINSLAYNVASVTSDTALVLSRAYTGASGSGLAANYDHSPKEGSYYTVTANGANSLTVNLNGDSLSAVAAGTMVTLLPYWTLGTAFPQSDASISYIDSPSSSPRSRATQILLPDLVSQGTDLAPTTIYYHYNGNWRLAGGSDSTISYDDVALPPTNYFIVRNTGSTTFTPTGSVYMNRISAPLATESTSRQDNAVAVPRPANVTLNDLGLVSSGAFTPSTSTSPRNRADALLVFDNTATGFDKSASNIYYYYAGAWRLAGATDSTVDYGSTVIPYGTGFTIQKAITTSGATSFWQNTRNY